MMATGAPPQKKENKNVEKRNGEEEDERTKCFWSSPLCLFSVLWINAFKSTVFEIDKRKKKQKKTEQRMTED